MPRLNFSALLLKQVTPRAKRSLNYHVGCQITFHLKTIVAYSGRKSAVGVSLKRSALLIIQTRSQSAISQADALIAAAAIFGTTTLRMDVTPAERILEAINQF